MWKSSQNAFNGKKSFNQHGVALDSRSQLDGKYKKTFTIYPHEIMLKTSIFVRQLITFKHARQSKNG
jgi:hypothetical protein